MTLDQAHGRSDNWLATYQALPRVLFVSPVEDMVAYAWDVGRNESEVGLIRAGGMGQGVLATDLSAVNWMDFSPDGKWLLVASSFAPLTLFEVATGARLPLATLPETLAAAWRS